MPRTAIREYSSGMDGNRVHFALKAEASKMHRESKLPKFLT